MMIELLEPLNEDSPICKFLIKHGSGSIYHIAFQVDDLNKYEQEVRQNGGIIKWAFPKHISHTSKI